MAASAKLREAAEIALGLVMFVAIGAVVVFVLFSPGTSGGGGPACTRYECAESDGGFIDHPDPEDVRHLDYEDVYPDEMFELEDPHRDGYDEGYDRGYEEGYEQGLDERRDDGW